MDAKRKKPWVKPEVRQIELTAELRKKFFPDVDNDFEATPNTPLRRASPR